ncbi:DMT family transporter [Candidatus Peregrinibacteria bacterium]|nr:DMT family transporter [Candidatus Peregrinibacteria bacterium]
MRITNKKELAGETFVFISILFNALEPIAINYSVKLIQPILFAGLYVFLCSILFLIYVLATKTFHEIFNKKAFKYILGVTAFIVIIPSILIFTGSKMTSGINTALLLQIEVFFTLLICGAFYKEKITSKKVISSLLIAIGAILILYNGNLNLNLGGLLIIAATIFYPFGNMCAKEALKLSSPAPILFLRTFLGGITLLTISFIFENSAQQFLPDIKTIFFSVIILSILTVVVAKIFWYKGLKKLEIGKAIAISTASPAISLIFAMIFLREIPTIYQIAGLTVIIFGVYLLTKKTKLETIT